MIRDRLRADQHLDASAGGDEANACVSYIAGTAIWVRVLEHRRRTMIRGLPPSSASVVFRSSARFTAPSLPGGAVIHHCRTVQAPARTNRVSRGAPISSLFVARVGRIPKSRVSVELCETDRGAGSEIEGKPRAASPAVSLGRLGRLSAGWRAGCRSARGASKVSRGFCCRVCLAALLARGEFSRENLADQLRVGLALREFHDLSLDGVDAPALCRPCIRPRPWRWRRWPGRRGPLERAGVAHCVRGPFRSTITRGAAAGGKHRRQRLRWPCLPLIAPSSIRSTRAVGIRAAGWGNR